MNRNRVNDIIKKFEGVGPDNTSLYTNQEIVDLLMELQRVMMTGVYERTHAEHMRDRDLMLHFSTLATEYGLKETETYKRFECNMNQLGFTIGSFIKGMKGEKIAKKALKLLTFDKNIKILYNIALEDEDVQAEYDAIVVAPYGIFVIEVKNWGAEMRIDENGILKRADLDIKYDLPGRMSAKEGLLRAYLKEEFPDKYQGIVLFSNENADVTDDYEKMPICYGGGIVYKVRSFDEGKQVISEKQIDKIVEIINNNHNEQRALCKVNCMEIIEDYATLMAAIEDAADGMYDSVEELKSTTYESDMKEEQINMEEYIKTPVFLREKKNKSNKKVIKVLIGTIGGGVVFGLGMIAGKGLTRR